jgi:hypothetical protein
MAVRVFNGQDFDDFLNREGVTTIPFYERDSQGQRRHSIYLGRRMASRVQPGDIVELVVNARTTKRGRNLKLGPIQVIQPAAPQAGKP